MPQRSTVTKVAVGFAAVAFYLYASRRQGRANPLSWFGPSEAQLQAIRVRDAAVARNDLRQEGLIQTAESRAKKIYDDERARAKVLQDTFANSNNPASSVMGTLPTTKAQRALAGNSDTFGGFGASGGFGI